MLGFFNHMHDPEGGNVWVGIFKQVDALLNEPARKSIGHALKTGRIGKAALKRVSHPTFPSLIHARLNFGKFFIAIGFE